VYTTFIVDEVGNRRVVMDWFKSTNAPFDWNEVTVESLLESHPNHCSGLEFAYYFTGDDCHPQSGNYVSGDYGLLPDFSQPDLPAPRTPLARTGQYTRESDHRASVPVRYEAKDLKESSKSRVRCGLCAWSLGLQDSFNGPGPIIESPPSSAETANHFAKILTGLIADGRTSRRRLAEAISHKKRWALVDRWCVNLTAGSLPRFPSDVQLKELLLGIDDPPVDALRKALMHDREHTVLEARYTRWRPMTRYPSWATLSNRSDGRWYHHVHCGRDTHDLAEVSHVPDAVALTIDGTSLNVLVEKWRNLESSWLSVAIPQSDGYEWSREALEQTVRTLLNLDKSTTLRTQSTDRFTFVCTEPVPL